MGGCLKGLGTWAIWINMVVEFSWILYNITGFFSDKEWSNFEVNPKVWNDVDWVSWWDKVYGYELHREDDTVYLNGARCKFDHHFRNWQGI